MMTSMTILLPTVLSGPADDTALVSPTPTKEARSSFCFCRGMETNIALTGTHWGPSTSNCMSTVTRGWHGSKGIYEIWVRRQASGINIQLTLASYLGISRQQSAQVTS